MICEGSLLKHVCLEFKVISRRVLFCCSLHLPFLLKHKVKLLLKGALEMLLEQISWAITSDVAAYAVRHRPACIVHLSSWRTGSFEAPSQHISSWSDAVMNICICVGSKWWEGPAFRGQKGSMWKHKRCRVECFITDILSNYQFSAPHALFPGGKSWEVLLQVLWEVINLPDGKSFPPIFWFPLALSQNFYTLPKHK